MTNVREEFEKWYELDDEEPLSTEYKIYGQRYLYKGYQAAHEAQQVRIDELELSLHEINKLRGSTLNFGVARAIACRALGIKHTDSSELPSTEKVCSSCKAMTETAIEASARAIDDHNQIKALEARCKELKDTLTNIVNESNINAYAIELAKQALSPTEKEVG